MTLREFGRSAAIPLALGLAFVPALLRGLALEGFYSGDSGVKLVASQQAAAHPARPFTIDLPRIGEAPATEFLGSFYVLHGDHAHAVTSPLFPALTAPFLSWFGLPGVYVLPALSLLLLVPLTTALARRLGLAGPPALYGVAVLATSPLVFYGLEYWEHAPAAAASAAAALLALRRRARPSGIAWAGLLSALAIQLRPEAAWSMAALCLALGAMGAGLRAVGLFAAVTAIGILPQVVHDAVHFGAPVGPHLARAFAESPESAGARLGFLRLWLGSWRPEGLWPAFPAGLLALATPRRDRAGAALWLLVLVPVAGVAATAPNDGGSQWAPRYLLGIVVPLLLLGVDAGLRLHARTGRSAGSQHAVWRGSRWVVAAVLVLAVGASAMSTRAAYRRLQGTKRPHARIARTLADLPERYVVSNAWWLDQFAAAAATTHTFLYTRDQAALTEVARRLAAAGVPRFVVVQSLEDTRWDTAALVAGAGYRTVDVTTMRERTLEVRVVAVPTPGKDPRSGSGGPAPRSSGPRSR